jgi:ABC-2 type transport system ATP-binding protein
LSHGPEGSLMEAKVKLVNDATTNLLLGNIMRAVEVHGFREVMPSMNDIFIRAVEESKQEATSAVQ